MHPYYEEMGKEVDEMKIIKLEPLVMRHMQKDKEGTFSLKILPLFIFNFLFFLGNTPSKFAIDNGFHGMYTYSVLDTSAIYIFIVVILYGSNILYIYHRIRFTSKMCRNVR